MSINSPPNTGMGHPNGRLLKNESNTPGQKFVGSDGGRTKEAGGARGPSVVPTDTASPPALGVAVCSSTPQRRGRRGQEPREPLDPASRSGRPALRPAPRDPQRPRVKREPRAAARASGHERTKRRAGSPAPPTPAPGPAGPGPPAAPLTRALEVVAGLHGEPPRCRSRRRRGCRGVARRTRLARASADTAQSSPTDRRRAAGRGVRLPEGRPGAGASPNRAPGCGRPAGLTFLPLRRCVTARAGL